MPGSAGIFPKNDGDTIYAADYNNISATVDSLLGNGLADSGYGQSYTSFSPTVDTKITVAQWSQLRANLLRIRQHQTGVDESAGLTIPTTSDLITNEFVNQYKNFATTCNTNRLTIASNQAALEPFAETVGFGTWNGTRVHTITVTFASANAARHWFNAGGQFRFTASRAGGAVNNKNTSWTNLLSNMGTITFNHGSTTYSGSGASTVQTSIGWYGLTTSDQTLFVMPAAAGVYLENDYNIQARKNANDNTATVLTFTIQFRDDDSGDPPILPLPKGATPGGVDESVSGDLTSTVQVFRPTGANVQLSAPSFTQSGF